MTSWVRCTSKVGGVRCGRVAGHPAEHRLPASAGGVGNRKSVSLSKRDEDAKTAYLAGWNASKRGAFGYDLGAAEESFSRTHRDEGDMYSAGWTDYSSDAPKWTQYDQDHRGYRR